LAYVSLEDERDLYPYQTGCVDEPLTDMKGCYLTKTSSENVFYLFSVCLVIVEETISKLNKMTSKVALHTHQEVGLALLWNQWLPNL
jgi:hypothetical protein